MTVIETDDRGLLVPCPHCGKRNRMDYERLDQHFQCGNCHTDLSLPRQPVEVTTEAAFEALITRSALPVLVDFWAPWCAPCKMSAPFIDEIAEETAGRWVVAKANTEQLPSVAQTHRVAHIPLLVLYVHGHEVLRKAGVMPVSKIRQLMHQALNPSTG